MGICSAQEVASLQNVALHTTFGRSLIRTRYNTTFTHASAVEIFTSVEKDGALKLYGYNVQSDLLNEN